MRTCSVEGCERPLRCKGFCKPHYYRWLRWGDPRADKPIARRVDGTAGERFWSKVDKKRGCWIWTAGKSHNGYGLFIVSGRKYMSHRWAYEDLRGPIPDGLQLDHLCRNRACVRPDHLEPVTPLENTSRGTLHNGNKTHCPQGHPYDAENTIISPRPNGGRARVCKTCLREGTRRRRAAARAAS